MTATFSRPWLDLDPRTKLLLLVLANVVAFTQKATLVEFLWVALLLVLIAVCGCGRAALKLGTAFAVCLLLQMVVFPHGPKLLATNFTLIVSYMRKIFPCLIVGTLLVQKTPASALFVALRRWHVPQSLIIPLAVTIRYFPAIREEAGYIRDAMKLCKVSGLQKLESFCVPLMVSATTTADELSAAAVTRGIENPAPKTSLLTLRLGVADVVVLALGLGFCAWALFTG